MFGKIVLLNAIWICCRELSLYKYFNKSRLLLCFDTWNNNLCCWYCIEYNFGTICDECTQLARELYREFIWNLYSINKYESLHIHDIIQYKDVKQIKINIYSLIRKDKDIFLD